MKLNLVAVAVAATLALPVVAQADGHEGGAELKIGGDLTIYYLDSEEDITAKSSEINVDATQGRFSGHLEIDFGDNGDAPSVEEMRIGINVGPGQLIIGETDNACDVFDPGPPDQALSAGTGGGCVSTDTNNIVYKGTAGATEYAVSYNIDTENGAAGETSPQTSVGLRQTIGPAKVNVGFVDDDGESNIHAGLSATFGAFTLMAEANDNENADDVAYGIYGQYAANGNTVWAAVDDIGDATLGYARDLGDNTLFFAEVDMYDDDAADEDFAVGLKLNF